MDAPRRPPYTVVALREILADEDAFRAWYDLTAPRVFAYLLARTGSLVIAEDLTQETYIEVIRHPDTFDGRADPVPWLVGIARHRLARYFMRNRRDEAREHALDREIDMRVIDDRPWSRLEDADALEQAMATLTPIQRVAALLRWADDLPVNEVAAAISRSEDATESLLRRARASIQVEYRRGRDA